MLIFPAELCYTLTIARTPVVSYLELLHKADKAHRRAPGGPIDSFILIDLHPLYLAQAVVVARA